MTTKKTKKQGEPKPGEQVTFRIHDPVPAERTKKPTKPTKPYARLVVEIALGKSGVTVMGDASHMQVLDPDNVLQGPGGKQNRFTVVRVMTTLLAQWSDAADRVVFP
jgi:hypothetical protein